MFPSQPAAVLERAARDARGDVNTALTIVLSQTDGESEQENPPVPPIQQENDIQSPPSQGQYFYKYYTQCATFSETKD